MTERLKVYLHKEKSVEEYEREISRGVLNYAWLCGHYQGMLDDLIKLFGKQDTIALVNAKMRILESGQEKK